MTIPCGHNAIEELEGILLEQHNDHSLWTKFMVKPSFQTMDMTALVFGFHTLNLGFSLGTCDDYSLGWCVEPVGP